MRKTFALSTAALLLATGAIAQAQSTPSNTANPPSTSNSSTSSSATAPSTSSPSAAQTPPASSTTQSTTQNNPPSSTSSSPAPSTQTQSNQSGASTSTSQSSQGTTSAPAQQQTNQSNQPNGSGAETATSGGSQTNVNVTLNDQQRTRVSQSFARLNVQPVANVNFSVSVGTVVPRDLRLQVIPADIVEIVPQYRGYSFFVIKDEIVIVDPGTYKIVTVLPRSGGSQAQTTTTRKTTFTDRDRAAVRKYSSAKREGRTTGSSATYKRIGVGERVPTEIELESFPDELYVEAPAMRDYRYYRHENRTYVIEPRERTVIEEID